MKVSVTREDIQAGERNDCYRCPVALALQRATDDGEANVYETDEGRLCLQAHGRELPAPVAVRRFVESFDASGPSAMKPFEFTLPPWDEWLDWCEICGQPCRTNELDEFGFCDGCSMEAE